MKIVCVGSASVKLVLSLQGGQKKTKQRTYKGSMMGLMRLCEVILSIIIQEKV
jgi:hypothetical protein